MKVEKLEDKMRLAFFDDYKLGVVVGDKIVDVSSVAKGIKALGPQDVIRTVIEKWSAYMLPRHEAGNCGLTVAADIRLPAVNSQQVA